MELRLVRFLENQVRDCTESVPQRNFLEIFRTFQWIFTIVRVDIGRIILSPGVLMFGSSTFNTGTCVGQTCMIHVVQASHSVLAYAVIHNEDCVAVRTRFPAAAKPPRPCKKPKFFRKIPVHLSDSSKKSLRFSDLKWQSEVGGVSYGCRTRYDLNS